MNLLSIGDGFFIGGLHSLINDLFQGLTSHGFLHSCCFGALGLDIVDNLISENSRLLGFQLKKAGEIFSFISDDHSLGEDREGSVDLIFNENRSNVFSSSSDDEFLYSSSN